MGFGSSLVSAVRGATAEALDAARDVTRWTVEQVQASYGKAQQAAAWMEDKARAGADRAAAAGVAAFDWGMRQARKAYDAGVATTNMAIDLANRAIDAGTVAAKVATAETLALVKTGGQRIPMGLSAVGESIDSFQTRIDRAIGYVMGNGSSGQPEPAADPVQPCPRDEAARKAGTRVERQQLIAAAREGGDPRAIGRADQLERDMDAVEEARLSNHIYCLHDPSECSAENSDAVGYTDVSDDEDALAEIGLEPRDLQIPGSNFRAAVFKRDHPPFSEAEAGYTVVFKGTSPGSHEDWRNNMRQGLDVESPYYRQAVAIGLNVSDALGNPPSSRVSFAGHSLGGGLASAAAAASGLPANTYNAAGLNDRTVARYGGASALHTTQIHAYNVPGDPLTEANASLEKYGVPQAVGARQTIDRAISDRVIPTDEPDTYFHSMPVVIRAIERRKETVQEQLRGAIPRF